MNNITASFEFAPGVSLRSITRDEQPWFTASDICNALSIGNTSAAVKSLDAEEWGFSSIQTLGGLQNQLVVSESGMYSLVIRSRKPQAKGFRDWITKVVLPSLRKDGVYIVGQEKPITDADTLPELLAQIAAIQAKVHALNADKLRSYFRHQEEKDARQSAFALMKGGSRRKSVPNRRPRKAIL